MSLKTKKHFSLFSFNVTANSESGIYAITRYRIIVFVTHSLLIKTIRYDQPPSLESELEIRSAPHGSCIDVVLRCVQ